MNENRIGFTVDRNNLYHEDSLIDLRAASIRCLRPVKPDGITHDESRKTIYVGHTQLMSPQGPVPLHASLEASTFEEAMEIFPEAMKKAMEEMIENVRKMQQEQESAKREESRIIV